MIWWDFTNFEFIVFFSIMMIVIVFVIVLIATLILLSKNRQIYTSKIFDEKNTTRIFTIDVRNNIVSYFDINNMRKKRTMNLGEFYNGFHQNDVEKVKGWIFSICMNYSKANTFIDADIMVGAYRQIPYYSILRLLKYSEIEGRIIIESNIMKYTIPKSYVPKEKKIPTGLVSKDALADVVNNTKCSEGFLFGIRFVNLNNSFGFDAAKEKYILYSTKNQIYPFVSGITNTRQLVDLNDNEMYLLDLHINTKEEAIAFGESILKEFYKNISINGFEDAISVTVSVVSNRMFFHDFDTLFDRAQVSTINMKGESKGVVYYERNSLYTVRTETTRFNNQINHLINDQSAIRVQYRPIIRTTDGEVIAYSSNLKLMESPFATLYEAARYASKIGKNKELIATVAKQVISSFSSEINNKNIKLFIQVSLLGIDSIKEILQTNSHIQNIHAVLVILEEELIEIINSGKTINDLYSQLVNCDYETAILFKTTNLSLDSSFYSCFNYFMLDSCLTKEVKRNTRNRLKVHSMIETLYKYKRPIIACDLEGWTTIELAMKSGINLISSETISPSSDMLLPVDKKKSAKIALMANKYK